MSDSDSTWGLRWMDKPAEQWTWLDALRGLAVMVGACVSVVAIIALPVLAGLLGAWASNGH